MGTAIKSLIITTAVRVTVLSTFNARPCCVVLIYNAYGCITEVRFSIPPGAGRRQIISGQTLTVADSERSVVHGGPEVLKEQLVGGGDAGAIDVGSPHLP